MEFIFGKFVPVSLIGLTWPGGFIACVLLSPLFPPSGFLWNRVIRKRFIIDNGLDHFANVRAQQPIDRDMHELRRVEIALRSTIALIRSS